MTISYYSRVVLINESTPLEPYFRSYLLIEATSLPDNKTLSRFTRNTRKNCLTNLPSFLSNQVVTPFTKELHVFNFQRSYMSLWQSWSKKSASFFLRHQFVEMLEHWVRMHSLNCPTSEMSSLGATIHFKFWHRKCNYLSRQCQVSRTASDALFRPGLSLTHFIERKKLALEAIIDYSELLKKRFRQVLLFTNLQGVSFPVESV